MSSDYIIDVQNLCKSFGDKEVVHRVNLQVKSGEIFGFLGPNGSGKTTTIRMICGLLKPTSGEGHCLGYDIIKDAYQIKKEVGYMTQQFSLYEDLTIRENLEFTGRVYQLKNYKTLVNEALENLGLIGRQNQLTGTLSGGWKRRLALAGAMLHQPKLLLLDEPTAGVDPKARRQFWNEIHELSERGITTLVSTHYMDEAERCHRLAYIAYGSLLATGTIPDVIKNAGLTMWVVSGENLNKLANQLRELPAIEQVTVFGKELHVVGTDKKALANAIKPFQKKPYTWEEELATLEDVFISLVGKAKDNFYLIKN
ncbi:MAG: ABC transporter ATP-binding protein [Gammaproteobacteria bacterium]|nr:ABC transporter ATP-binding protein [Gammaproteobacteria bacterium]